MSACTQHQEHTEYEAGRIVLIDMARASLKDKTCQCRYNPIKTMKTSFLGTMNMLGLAKRVRARFLLTSTSEVKQP